ncbi:MAG: hypothetical protein K1X50_10835, partial [Candidatus Promineofilum sp.]|nr:hypothetical protein [Promineifilum sp.]
MRSKLVVLLIFVALFAVACGGTATQTETEPTAPAEATIETAVEEAAATEEPAAAEPTAEAAAPAEGDGAMPMADPLAVSGNIVVAGSSTVFPLAETIAERYQSEGFSGQITIDSVGTGGGFERFCG